MLPRIAVLMAVHNRRELTIRALTSLDAAKTFFDITVVLLDDGSTDGTAQAVSARWPKTKVVTGDGTLFWNGGMHRAWSYARKLDMNGYLWLNDDVELDTDALSKLAHEWSLRGGSDAEFILVGATRDENGYPSYGGQMLVRSPFALRFDRLPPANSIRRADTFNGNIVLVTRATENKIGINDPRFLHTLGDIDYGLRATAAGVPVLVMPGTLGVCNNNKSILEDVSGIGARFKVLTSHRGIPIKNWWRITARYSGIWMPFHFLLAYRKILFK